LFAALFGVTDDDRGIFGSPRVLGVLIDSLDVVLEAL